MEMRHEITLPKTEGFYTQPFNFPVELVHGACKQYDDPKSAGPSLGLSLNPQMQVALNTYGKSHNASLDEIAHSALQYFRTSHGSTEALDHIDLRFMLTYDFGRIFTSDGDNHHAAKLGLASSEQSQRHGESVKHSVEMFGYGLALHYVANVLGVSSDRFSFLRGNGNRPDFVATYSIDKLLTQNPLLETINTAGQRVYVEVKARTGWASMRETNQKNDLLYNCAQKAQSCPNGILLSILIALPARSDSPKRTPKILIADPNDPEPLTDEEQVLFLLDRYMMLAQRYGLRLFKRNILRWKRVLAHQLSDKETQVLRKPDDESDSIAQSQYKESLLLPREFGNRRFQGRTFSSLLLRLGSPRNRQITVAEAEAAMRENEWGTTYFAGVDMELMEIVAQQKIKELLYFGTRGGLRDDLVAKSAFTEQQVRMEDNDRNNVQNAVRIALDKFRETKVW